MDLMLWGKNFDLNNFKSDVLYDAIEESRLDFEDNRYDKGELSKTKYVFTQKMDSIRGHHLQLLIITEKQLWCDPIICHHKIYIKS